MTRKTTKVLSASRRTDIPAFYLDWFMDGLQRGRFEVKNPYNGSVRQVDASKESVHSIVFWSKNYGPFLTANAGEQLERLGFKFYFNFTITSESDLLEPGVPPLKERLAQLEELAHRFGSEKIAWRFDPVCFFSMDTKGPVKDNLSDFDAIANAASRAGIIKCVTSFMDDYAKIRRRLVFFYKNHQHLRFIDPPTGRKTTVIKDMEQRLSALGIELFLCCEKEFFSALGPDTSVRENACVDGHFLKKIFGGRPEVTRDYGQRSKQGCRCTKAVDIGSYDRHPCFHNCLFCYANPDMDNQIKQERNK